MKDLWRWWIHLFIAAKKKNYTVLSIKFLWIMESLSPEVKAIYDDYRVFSFTGDEGTGIPADGCCELVNIMQSTNNITLFNNNFSRLTDM